LAVDDIKGVQDNAVLQRLEMQVNLNLDVEKKLPEWLRRKIIVRGETIYPNKRRNILAKFFYDDYTLQRITRNVKEKKSQVSLCYEK
jgi:hypothetical protein